MKNKYKIIALFSAVLISTSIMSACTSNPFSTTSYDNYESSVSTSIAEIEESKSGNVIPSNDESEVSSPEASNTESSVDESSVSEESEAQDSSPESSQPDDSSVAESSENTSSTVESSTYEGYYFDDEQIVEDYHTATVFTDNEEFNNLFSNNAIDAAYNSELQNVSSIIEMRNVTTSYAKKWQSEVSTAYDKLYSLLSDNSEAKTALENSQTEWNKGLSDIENSFYSEASASGAGTEALLSADTAIMNYYKGRTAVLYEQIYELTGNFEM